MNTLQHSNKQSGINIIRNLPKHASTSIHRAGMNQVERMRTWNAGRVRLYCLAALIAVQSRLASTDTGTLMLTWDSLTSRSPILTKAQTVFVSLSVLLLYGSSNSEICAFASSVSHSFHHLQLSFALLWIAFAAQNFYKLFRLCCLCELVRAQWDPQATCRWMLSIGARRAVRPVGGAMLSSWELG